MRLFQAPLNSCLGSPFFANLSVHGLHFTVYAPSNFLSHQNSEFAFAFAAVQVSTVRAEIITELIPKRAGPIIF